MINIAVSGGRVIVHIAIIKRGFWCNGHIKGTGGDIIIIILPPSSFPLFLPHGSSVSLLLYILSPAIADWGKAPFYSAGQPLTFLCPSGRAKTDSRRRRQRDCAVEMMTNLLSSLFYSADTGDDDDIDHFVLRLQNGISSPSAARSRPNLMQRG